MKIVNKVLISISDEDIKDGKFTNKEVIEVANGCFNEMPNLRAVSLPNVKIIGSYCFRSNHALTEISLPVLTTAGSYCFRSNDALTEISLPALTTAGSDCFSSNDALTEISLPVLTTAGSYCFRSNHALTEISLPALTTAGSDCFRYNDALTEISLLKKKYKVKNVDGYCYVIEATKTSKGIKIYTGYNILSIDYDLHKQPSYVAEKDGFYAHGETVKKAIQDLQFKIVAEKLKSEPIKADMIITINHYRLITGACELGVKSWMEQHQIEEGIKAFDLLPILKRTHAYGVDKFSRLITF